MQIFALKNIKNRRDNEDDLYNFRKQRNVVVKLNGRDKKKHLDYLPVKFDGKPF